MKNFTLILMLFALVSCATAPKQSPEPLKILISKDANRTAAEWLLGVDSTLDISIVYNLAVDSAVAIASQVDAIVITGGDDINPRWYNTPEYDQYCEGYDDYRDSLEIAIINYAMANDVPILGICRGHQIMNVANGGTMIPDIETFKKLPESAHRERVKMDSIHTVIPTANSWITANYPNNGGKYWVNTIHHQSVDKIAEGFEVAAMSPDGIIESIILNDPNHFALGVQWHPERSRDEFATVIANMLFSAARGQNKE